jgi:hypothetical protein
MLEINLIEPPPRLSVAFLLSLSGIPISISEKEILNCPTSLIEN